MMLHDKKPEKTIEKQNKVEQERQLSQIGQMVINNNGFHPELKSFTSLTIDMLSLKIPCMWCI